MDQCHATVMAARKRSIRHLLLLFDLVSFIRDLLATCIGSKMA